MNRITDERLAEIRAALPAWRVQERYSLAQELLAALKAERAYARELEAQVAVLTERNTRLRQDNYGMQDEWDTERRRAEAAESALERIRALPGKWRADAASRIPEDYTARGLERKYLNCDNYAGGQADCADELEALLPK